MEYKDWKPIRRIEINYSQVINSLINELFQQFDFDNPFSFANIFDIINSDQFYDISQIIANKMCNNMYNTNLGDWRKAYRNGTHGREMYLGIQQEMQGPIGNLLLAQTNRNAELIKNLPIGIAQEITRYVTEQQMRGRRAEDISDDLRNKVPTMTKARSNLIARTECSKADTELNKARSIELGIPAYIWRTSEDGRVRSSHKHMDKVIVFWNNPPSPEKLIGAKHTYGNYHAGEIFNCRCYTEPLIDIDFIHFPYKLYNGSSIVRVSRKQFEKLL